MTEPEKLGQQIIRTKTKHHGHPQAHLRLGSQAACGALTSGHRPLFNPSKRNP